MPSSVTPIQKTYVVEHMEPEIGAWSTLEYITIAKETADAGSQFYLTSLQPQLADSLPQNLQPLVDRKKFTATTTEVPLLDGLTSDRVCLLDPQAKEELSPEDGEMFDWFVFGGILGDHPPRDRTAELRKYGYQGRHLGKIQMTTDTAVRVTRLIVEGKRTIEQIPFVDYPELKIDKNESTQMPFRYVRDEARPIMPEGMIELIKEDANKSLNDLL